MTTLVLADVSGPLPHADSPVLVARSGEAKLLAAQATDLRRQLHEAWVQRDGLANLVLTMEENLAPDEFDEGGSETLLPSEDWRELVQLAQAVRP